MGKNTLQDIEDVQRGMQRVVQKLGELRQRQVSTQKMRAMSLEEAEAALAAHTEAEGEQPVPSKAPETQPAPILQDSDDPPPFRPSMPPRSSTYSHVAPPASVRKGKR